MASFPPSSRLTGMSRSPARAATARPVRVEPVNITMSTSSTTAVPVEPSPVATARTAGPPTSSRKPRTHSTHDRGATSDGLDSTAAPAMRAGTMSMAGAPIGPFQGVMTPTSGWGRNRSVRFLAAPAGPWAGTVRGARNSAACRA